MGQKVTHALAPGAVINTGALRKEFDAYVAWQGRGGTTLNKAGARKFVRDFCDIYKVDTGLVSSILVSIDLDEASHTHTERWLSGASV